MVDPVDLNGSRIDKQCARVTGHHIVVKFKAALGKGNRIFPPAVLIQGGIGLSTAGEGRDIGALQIRRSGISVPLGQLLHIIGITKRMHAVLTPNGVVVLAVKAVGILCGQGQRCFAYLDRARTDPGVNLRVALTALAHHKDGRVVMDLGIERLIVLQLLVCRHSRLLAVLCGRRPLAQIVDGKSALRKVVGVQVVGGILRVRCFHRGKAQALALNISGRIVVKAGGVTHLQRQIVVPIGLSGEPGLAVGIVHLAQAGQLHVLNGPENDCACAVALIAGQIACVGLRRDIGLRVGGGFLVGLLSILVDQNIVIGGRAGESHVADLHVPLTGSARGCECLHAVEVGRKIVPHAVQTVAFSILVRVGDKTDRIRHLECLLILFQNSQRTVPIIYVGAHYGPGSVVVSVVGHLIAVRVPGGLKDHPPAVRSRRKGDLGRAVHLLLQKERAGIGIDRGKVRGGGGSRLRLYR